MLFLQQNTISNNVEEAPMPMPVKDLTGTIFGALVVTGRDLERPNHRKRIYWFCRCACDRAISVRSDALTRGTSTSCGCVYKRVPPNGDRRHGLSGIPEHFVWLSIIRRCTNPKQKSWDKYGGRGIKICDRWLYSFENFYADMGPRPSPKHSIDHRDNDGDYEPNNCRWATQIEQANNTRRNHFVEFNGKRQTISQWARELGINMHTLNKRINRGTPVEIALRK